MNQCDKYTSLVLEGAELNRTDITIFRRRGFYVQYISSNMTLIIMSKIILYESPKSLELNEVERESFTYK